GGSVLDGPAALDERRHGQQVAGPAGDRRLRLRAAAADRRPGLRRDVPRLGREGRPVLAGLRHPRAQPLPAGGVTTVRGGGPCRRGHDAMTTPASTQIIATIVVIVTVAPG